MAIKKVFFLYTCAKKNSKFTEHIKKEALEKGAVIMGEYGCRGYNTYGPWKVIGGMNKNHPSQEELEEAILFYETLLISLQKLLKYIFNSLMLILGYPKYK